MIKVLGKISDSNGVPMVYLIDEDGAQYKIFHRAFYNEMYFEALKESGFKFYDYNGTIRTPDGTLISELPELLDVNITDVEVDSLQDMCLMGMIPEQELLSSFEVETNFSFIEVKEPVNPRFKTQSELEDYISSMVVMGLTDYRPINSLVSRGALYSIDDLGANSSKAPLIVTQYFSNLLRIRSKKDMNRFISEFGLTDDMSLEDKLKAILNHMLEYGVPMFKDKILKIDTGLYDPQLNTATNYIGLYDNNNMRFLTAHEYDKNASSGMGLPEAPAVDPTKFKLNGYTVKPYYEYKLAPMVYVLCVSPSNIRYSVVMNANGIVIKLADKQGDGVDALVLGRTDMFCVTGVDDEQVSITSILENGWKYLTDRTYIRKWSKDYLDSLVVKPMFNSSREIFEQSGINTFATPSYIARKCYPQYKYRDGSTDLSWYDDEADDSSEYKYKMINSRAAASIQLVNGFSDKLLLKYCKDNFQEVKAGNIMEQYDSLLSIIEPLMDEGKYLVKPEEQYNGFEISKDWAEWHEEFTADELGSFEFGYKCLNGDYNIGEFSLGQARDAEVDVDKLVNAIHILYTFNGSGSIKSFINGDLNNYFNIRESFYEKSNAARGCLKDLQRSMHENVMQAKTILYVTKIFREIANRSNQHYMFEALAFNKEEGKSLLVFNSILDQIKAQLSSYNKYISPYVCNIIMSIAGGNNRSFNGGSLPYTIVGADGQKFDVTVNLSADAASYIKNGMFSTVFATLDDFCRHQIAFSDGRVVYQMMNAHCTPWEVIPHNGQSIPVYSTFINGLPDVYLNAALSEGTKANLMVTSNVPYLNPATRTSMLPQYFEQANLFANQFDPYADFLGATEEIEQIKNGYYLNDGVTEGLKRYTLYAFFKHSELKRNKLNSDRIPTKADVYYKHLYTMLYDKDVEDTYVTSVATPDNTYFNDFILNGSVQEKRDDGNRLITTAKLTARPVSILDLPIEVFEDPIVMDNDFDTSKLVRVRYGVLYCNDVEVNLRAPERVKLDKLVDDLHIAAQISNTEYLIRFGSRLILVEV